MSIRFRQYGLHMIAGSSNWYWFDESVGDCAWLIHFIWTWSQIIGPFHFCILDLLYSV